MPSVSAASACDAGEAVDADREGEQEFAVAAALAFRAQGDRGLAAGQDQHRLLERAVAGGDLAGKRGMHAADLARLALDGVGQDDRLDALALRFRRSGFERHGGRGDDMHLVAGKARIVGHRRGRSVRSADAP